MSDVPIADHALLSDCQGAALVTREGSVDWLCPGRFDADAQLARLLDPAGGHWSIRPTVPAETSRRYRDGTLVLETTRTTDRGVVRLVDALATGLTNDEAHGHDLGRRAPHALLRVVEGVEGVVDLEVELAPRPEYGLVHPLLRAEQGGVSVRGGACRMTWSTPDEVEASVEADGLARAHLRVHAGDRLGFALQHGSLGDELRWWSQGEIVEALEHTEHAWRTWSRTHQRYEGPWRDLVHHSGRVLEALTYRPTGAIVAAPTTSLPETPGGVRNWDYRYAWVRDASFTLDALWVAACPDEAIEYFDFFTAAAATSLQRGLDLQIMFGIGGEHDLSERQLEHLSGWRGSAPVRVGNGAWSQRQLDVYGELLDAALRLSDYLAERLDDQVRAFLVAVADTAAQRWTETDQGIWEVRDEPRHFLYSKLMCWVALDRAVRLAGLLDAEPRVGDWQRTRDEIEAEILERGWSEAAGAFTQAFDSDALDASALMLPIVGFLPGDDERVVATIEAIERDLTDDRGLVYRYLTDDGLAGGEGTFVLCTFWLAEAWARAGRVDRAREVFERVTPFVNDVGLLAEEVDPTTGELLGNFPQAFSHIGLVNAAWAIAVAERPELAEPGSAPTPR